MMATNMKVFPPNALRLTAQGLVGIPFKSLGRDQSGVDCLGLVLLFWARMGIEIPDPLTKDPDRVLNHVLMDEWTPVTDARAGDTVVYQKSESYHMGIQLSDGRVLQALNGPGVVVARLSGGYKVIGRYRLKALV